MKHLAYSHAPNVSLVGAVAHLTRHALRLDSRSPIVRRPRDAWRSRLLTCGSWLIVLCVQAALILLVAELVELAHGVIGLYLDLAKIQLDLSSQYVAVTNPPTK
jgi:hypothetical protein